jgi:hypothetical protein
VALRGRVERVRKATCEAPREAPRKALCLDASVELTTVLGSTDLLAKSCKVDASRVELVTVLSGEFSISAVKVLLSYEWEQISGACNMVDQNQIKLYCKPGVKPLILWSLDVCSLFGGRG